MLRFASVKHTDKRVRVMNEIISGIKVIKMYGWEYAFQKLIVGIRKSVCVRVCIMCVVYIMYVAGPAP